MQGIEDVLGFRLAQVRQHCQAEGMAAVQVLERRKHAVDVVVGPVAVAPGRGFDPGQHVEDHEAVMPSLDVVAQPLDAAVVEQRKVVEQLEPAGGLDTGLDGAQAALDAAPAVFQGEVEDWLRFTGGEVLPDRGAGGDRQGEIEHEPGLAALALAAEQQHAFVQ